jgi:hypothetical protein
MVMLAVLSTSTVSIPGFISASGIIQAGHSEDSECPVGDSDDCCGPSCLCICCSCNHKNPFSEMHGLNPELFPTNELKADFHQGLNPKDILQSIFHPPRA